MNNDTRTAWAKVNRDYQKVMKVLTDASEALAQKDLLADQNDPTYFAFQLDTLRATELLDKAANQVNDEYSAARKALGVGVYTPYGRPVARRY